MKRMTLNRLACLRDDTSGVALIEFAYTLPVILLMMLAGAETTNYITTRTRVSQLALHLADDAGRMGNGTLLSSKTINEADINDLFVGANLQSGELDLNGRGRVILSDLEPVANPNTSNKYKIVWQRCYGTKTSHTSTYGTAGQTNLNGIGPAGQQVTAQDDNATMFVEVYYEYKPIINLNTIITGIAPSMMMLETASTAVRDRRDLTQIYNAANVPVASC
ncbi:MAG: TadE/TadG family type IV pilus assembly protein [Sphingomonas sp.]|jgi:Flp pilus assembly protein TadG